jgi:ribosomal protein S18 acetylase RimI-like enzyme
MNPVRHPAHDQLTPTVHNWFHLPYQAMGYLAEQQRWGTYWNNGMVYPQAESFLHGIHTAQVQDFLVDVEQYYKHRVAITATESLRLLSRIYICVDDTKLDAKLGPALCAAGCTIGKRDIFLAHVGPCPDISPVEGLEITQVDASNLVEFVTAKLKAFANDAATPTEENLQAELKQRQAELSGTAQGMLARVWGQTAGILWRYEEKESETTDWWINWLGTCISYRGQGIGSALLNQCLADGYVNGCRSVMINVLVENERAIRLYRRLGFQDKIYWRQRYILEL